MNLPTSRPRMQLHATLAVALMLLLWLAWQWLQRPPAAPTAQALAPGYPVVVFVTPNCRVCERAEKLLRQQQVPYFVYDLTTSAEGLKHFEVLGGLAAPMLVVGSQVLRGFNPERTLQALKAQGISTHALQPSTPTQ